MASLMQMAAGSLDGQTAHQTIGFAVSMLFGALNRNASNPAGAESLNNAQIG